MIRCVGAALRGDGNPPEFPLYALSFVRITGYGVSPSHMSAALCAHKCRACRTTLRSKVVSYISEGALIKDGLRPSVSAPFLRQRIYTLIRRKV